MDKREEINYLLQRGYYTLFTLDKVLKILYENVYENID